MGMNRFARAPTHVRKVVLDILLFSGPVVFNVYGPRAISDDVERIEFKHQFYAIIGKRWECLLRQGRRVFVVGDLNIAPFAMDRCEVGPNFEKNEFRKWFRSLLVERGGAFSDVFRSKHPERKDAFTCWS